MTDQLKSGDICRFKRHPTMDQETWEILSSKFVVLTRPVGYTVEGVLCWGINPPIRVKVDGRPMLLDNAARTILIPIRDAGPDNDVDESVDKPVVKEKELETV